MTREQAIAFAILVAMMAMFVWDRFRYDLVAALALLAALALGVVEPQNAFKGFADEVVIIIASALVISAAIGKSNLIERAIRRLEPRMKGIGAQVFVLSAAVTVLSMIMKNIGALAIFLPIAVQLARRTGTPVSALLMPMSFGSLVGGLVTLVGTSPNVLVARARQEMMGEPFGMFDFTPVGIGIAAATLAFLAVGWRLLPSDRRGQPSAAEAFESGPYLTEALAPQDWRFAGRTVTELEDATDGDMTVLSIIREGDRRYVPAGHWTLYEGDRLVVRSDPQALQRVIAEAGLTLPHANKGAVGDLPAEAVSVTEAVVMGGSPLIGRTPQELRLRQAHGVNLLAIARRGRPMETPLRQIRFRAGDVLALQGPSDSLPDALRALDCLPLVDRATRIGEPARDYLPLVLLGLAMGAVAFGLAPIAAAFFAAAVLSVLLGVLTLREAYDAIDAPILVLLACLIPISDAISATGGAELIAGLLAVPAALLPGWGMVTLVLVAAMLLTPFLNNAATALIMAPVAASLARELGLSPDPFLMAVAIGCACDFLTPIGHQCNTLVMGPGGYRFGDYWKLGLPLSLIVALVATMLIPLAWPLRG